MMAFEKITKIDAARRQINEAIRLFFERREELAIHTLAGASHEILKDIGQKQNIVGFLKNISLIKSDKVTEYLKLVNYPKNFLKHANWDTEEVLKFNPALNEIWLFDSIHLYRQITGENPYEMNVFLGWFMTKHPDLFPEPLKHKLKELKTFEDFEDYDFFLKELNNSGRK
jgi:hypothetical protein